MNTPHKFYISPPGESNHSIYLCQDRSICTFTSPKSKGELWIQLNLIWVFFHLLPWVLFILDSEQETRVNCIFFSVYHRGQISVWMHSNNVSLTTAIGRWRCKTSYHNTKVWTRATRMGIWDSYSGFREKRRRKLPCGSAIYRIHTIRKRSTSSTFPFTALFLLQGEFVALYLNDFSRWNGLSCFINLLKFKS